MKLALSMIVALALLLAACGGDGSDASSIPADEPFNQADVDFSTEMIKHHAQALTMVDLTDRRQVSPELAELAGEIRMAQAPEIELMTDWLIDWDQPIPETVRDHANAHGEEQGEEHGDTTELEAAEGVEFERMWLEMMIEHHEGAIEMARTEEADGEFPAAIDLAAAIIEAQQAEIDVMESMLGS